jgi:transketolase
VIYGADSPFEIGRANVLRPGQDVAIIACGIMVAKALEAAQRLAEENIQAAVVDMHTIKPLDEEVIARMAEQSGAILTVEEHSIIGGLGSAVCETVCARHPVPVMRMGINDVFGQSGEPEQLLDYYGLNVEKIMLNVRDLLRKK